MIVGRDEELRVIADLLAAARSGHSRVLVLRGEAGVGKSTLLQAATDRADGMTVLSCAGVESEVQLAFSGLHQLLARTLDCLDTLPTAQADALRDALGLSNGQATDLLVSAGVLGLLAAAAEQGPLLVTVDDAQWLDRASIGALLFVFRRLLADPIAVLMAVRDPDVHPLVTADLPEHRLTGLAPDAAGALLDRLGSQATAPIRDAFIELTGGNPLALSELAHIDGTAALTGTIPLGARLQAAFTQGVAALPDDARTMLLVAASDESGDRSTVLGAAARLGAAPEALNEIEHAQLIDVTQHGLQFRHPLIRAAVHQDADSAVRSTVHRALGDELSHAGQADRATWHYALAATDPDERLATALENAAETTGRRGGSAAIAAGLQLAARLSTTSEGRTRRLVTAAFASAHAGQIALAETMIDQATAERPDRATATRLARLRGMIDLDSGDPALAYDHLIYAAETSPPDTPAETASLLLFATDAAHHSDRLDNSIAAAQRIAQLDTRHLHQIGTWLAQAVAGQLPRDGTEPWNIAEAIVAVVGPRDPRGTVWPFVVSWLGPHQRQARAFGLRAARMLRTAGVTGALAPLLTMLVDLDYHLGLWPTGQAHADEGLRFAHDTGQLTRLADLLALRARLSAARGDHAACRHDVEQALALALPQHNRAAAANATWAAGLVALTTGDATTAYNTLTNLTIHDGPHSHQLVRRAAMPDLIEAAVRTGNHDQAVACLNEFSHWAKESTLDWANAHLHRCRALLAADADEHFTRARQSSMDRPFDQARIALLHGEWLRRDRRPTAAREQLRTAVGLFDTLGATTLADRARCELRAAGGSAGQARTLVAAGRLTPQELQVAQLAATGLSNRDIGQQLFLSPRTVGYHLYKLFPKLGITQREQLRDIDLDGTLPTA